MTHSRVLIVGADGTIGRGIYKALSPLYETYAPTNLELDLSSEGNLKAYIEHNCLQNGILINCAFDKGAISQSNTFIRNNFAIIDNICLNANLFRQIIHMGSYIEVDSEDSVHNTRQSLYRDCKIYGRKKLSLLSNARILTLGECYNGMTPLDSLIDKLIKGENLKARTKNLRFRLFVDLDFVIASVMTSMENNLSGIENLWEDQPYTYMDLQHIVGRMRKKNLEQQALNGIEKYILSLLEKQKSYH